MADYPRCRGMAKSGLPCRNQSTRPGEWDGLCFMHWCRATGRKMPQEYRRKVKHGTVAELLGVFGLGKADILRLRASVPEVDSIMSKNTGLMDALDLTCRALAVRLIARPDRDVADSLAVLARFVEAGTPGASGASGGLVDPLRGAGGGFTDLFAEFEESGEDTGG